MKVILSMAALFLATSALASTEIPVGPVTVTERFQDPTGLITTTTDGGFQGGANPFAGETRYLSPSDENAVLFCRSKGYDKAISYTTLDAAFGSRAVVTKLDIRGNAVTTKFDVLRQALMSSVTCAIETK